MTGRAPAGQTSKRSETQPMGVSKFLQGAGEDRCGKLSRRQVLLQSALESPPLPGNNFQNHLLALPDLFALRQYLPDCRRVQIQDLAHIQERSRGAVPRAEPLPRIALDVRLAAVQIIHSFVENCRP